MKKVGILVGREMTFPVSLINSVNERGAGEVVAEFVKVGGVRHDGGKEYDLIVDRISHQVPFYRAYLKRAALEGTVIINNPFWWSADDKFFNYSLAEKLGVAVPRTVLLPQKDYMEDITGDSLRNLEFPLDWQGIVDYVGFPAFIKPFDGGGWKNVSKLESLEELWQVYDTTGQLCMTLQQGIEFDQFVRCYCIGQQDVMIMPYDPRKAYLSGEQYLHNPGYLSAELAERVGNDVRTLCRALGYDINTVEFAIKDGVPYAIDFMNPAPDAEVASVGEFYHNWLTDSVTDLIFRRLAEGQVAPPPRYRWDAMLNPPAAASPASALSAVASTASDAASSAASAATSAASSAASTIESYIPDSVRDSVREATSDLAAAAGELVGTAREAVSDIISTVADAAAPEHSPKPAASKTSAKRPPSSSTTKAKSTAAKKGSSTRAKKPAPGA